MKHTTSLETSRRLKINKGTILEYSNHAGKHLVEYIREIPEGSYTKLVGKWNGFNNEMTTDCFRYQGILQSSWKIIKSL